MQGVVVEVRQAMRHGKRCELPVLQAMVHVHLVEVEVQGWRKLDCRTCTGRTRRYHLAHWLAVGQRVVVAGSIVLALAVLVRVVKGELEVLRSVAAMVMKRAGAVVEQKELKRVVVEEVQAEHFQGQVELELARIDPTAFDQTVEE